MRSMNGIEIPSRPRAKGSLLAVKRGSPPRSRPLIIVHEPLTAPLSFTGMLLNEISLPVSPLSTKIAGSAL